MENATKALLIAAAVLIAIVLIALGVRLLSTAGDTGEQADAVGEGLKTSVETQTENLTGTLEKWHTSEPAGE